VEGKNKGKQRERERIEEGETERYTEMVTYQELNHFQSLFGVHEKYEQ
jgi:hypothetical protein